MKLNGKKVLALLLALAMAFPMFGVTASAVNVSADYENEDLKYEMAYTGDPDEDEIDLEEIVEYLLEYEYNDYIEIVDVEIYSDAVTPLYGTISERDWYTVLLTNAQEEELYKDYYLEERSIVYKAWDDDDYTYTGDLDITITAYDYDLEYDLEGKTEFYLGAVLAKDLDDFMTAKLDYVEFTLDKDNDCGTLYADDKETEFDETERYFYKGDADDYDLEELYFVPNGSEGEFIIEYYAEDWEDNEYEGVITLLCGGAILVEAEVDNDSYYTFDVSDFQAAVRKWDKAYSLVYIDNVKLSDSDDGYLYYLYDEDDRNHDKISGTEEYYVDEEEDDLLEDISYVPSKEAKGTVIVTFDARVAKSETRYTTIPGILEIEVEKSADITIEAKAGKKVEIDHKLFQEYLEEDTDSYRYDVAYVTISGAPRSKSAGYLVTDNEQLTSRSDKTFYMNPKTNEYDLEDLWYLAGEDADTYSATFVVYYYTTSSSKKATATTEGTIDFVVPSGPSSTKADLTSTITASQTLKFSTMMNEFIELGDNENAYFVFTALPESGKLVYNWGSPTQEDVKTNTVYFVRNAAGKNYLGNITYVPGYSFTKATKTVSIGLMGYNADEDSVAGAFKITVNHSFASSVFTDVTTYTYADSVDFLYNEGITNGVDMANYKFGIYDKVTRAQFVTFLWRAAGEPSVTGVTNNFSDVKSTGSYAYAYEAILWAVKNGITNGKSATTFAPGANVTHQELLTFLYRYDVTYLGHSGTGSYSVSYSDWSSVMPYAQTAVKWADYKGIIGDSIAIAPTSDGTRATVALWLHRMLTM